VGVPCRILETKGLRDNEIGSYRPAENWQKAMAFKVIQAAVSMISDKPYERSHEQVDSFETPSCSGLKSYHIVSLTYIGGNIGDGNARENLIGQHVTGSSWEMS